MPIRLNTETTGFADQFAALLTMKREISEEVDSVAAAIIADVQARGDAALIALTKRFDDLALTPETLRVSSSEIDSALRACPKPALDALHFAHERIVAFHERQRPLDSFETDDAGVSSGWRWSAIAIARPETSSSPTANRTKTNVLRMATP